MSDRERERERKRGGNRERHLKKHTVNTVRLKITEEITTLACGLLHRCFSPRSQGRNDTGTYFLGEESRNS